MINALMRSYDYYIYGEKDAYGQPSLSEQAKGKIKMAVTSTSVATQDNILYKDATYIGLTKEPIDDTYVVRYGDEKLKVQYVMEQGRFKQAFMKNI